MILARPTKSLIRYIQMIGRVLRPHATKDRALVIDHSGTVQRLGFPTDDLPLELDDGRAKEAAKPKAEEALPKKCPSCHAIKPPKIAICPKCGFQQVMANKVESIDGELSLVQKGKLKATAAEKQLFYSELLALKGKRSDGWVAHAYKDKFGVWPRGMKDIPKDPRPETRSWVTAKMIRFAKGQEAGARHAA